MPPDTIATALSEQLSTVSIMEKLEAEGLKLLISLGSKLLIALVILVIGFWVARRLVKVANKILVAREVDETLRPFLRSTVSFLLKAVVIVIAISTMGVEMTSIIAILGSIGLAIGLALQGSLANFAGGILILTLKPIKKGELIEAQGTKGRVEEINVMNTVVLTLDNKTVFLPNGPLAGGSITNYTRQNVRRVDITFSISYQDDFEQAKSIILSLANASAFTLQEPQPPFVRVNALSDSSVDIIARIWTQTETYFDLYHDMIEQVKTTFEAQGITIPYPQRDVHMLPSK
jgi:small conductance mechanosensitive channel